jgi:hypothetical protein
MGRKLGHQGLKGTSSGTKGNRTKSRFPEGGRAGRTWRPWLERLEDRLAPATNITVITGAAGAGNLDHFLNATHGTITVNDDSGDTNATLSTGALAGVNSTTNISIAADATITFNDLGGTFTVQTGPGNSATFTTTTGAISFSSTANTLTTAGGSITFSAGTNLTVCNLNTGGGDVSLTAGAGAAGNLTFGGILTSGSGNLTFQATNAAGGTISQTGTASGLAVSATATGDITVDGLRGTTVGLTSNLGSIKSLGANAVQASSQLTLSASSGITLNTLAATLQATNSTSGNISITQAASPAQTLTVSGTGVVNNAAGGTITITNLGSSIAIDPGVSVTSNNGDITLAALDFQLSGTINSGTAVTTLENSTANRQIDVGTNTAGKIGLTQSELNNVTAAVLHIGSGTAGDINVSAAISGLTGTNVLALLTGGNITEAAAGALGTGAAHIPNLRVSAGGAVALTGNNQVDVLAGDSGGAFTFVEDPIFMKIDTVDGETGVKTNNNSNIELTSFNFDISQQVNAGTGRVTLQPFSATQQIILGSTGTLGGDFGLTDAELDHVTAGVLQIGNSSNIGGIFINSAITRHAGYNTLSLITGAGVTQSAALSVANLAVQAGGISVLTNAGNDVDKLAGQVSSAGQKFSYTDTNGFTVSTVDGVAGISTPTGGGEIVTLTAGGSVTQDTGASIISDNLLLLGTGGYSLDNSGNDVTTLAANVSNAVSYTDKNNLTIGTVNGTSGVTATGGNISITTAHDLTVSQPVSTATTGPNAGAVTLTGGTAAGSNINVFSTITGSSASVLGGTGADVIAVQTTGATPLTVNANGGNDTVTVGNSSNGLGSLAGPLTVDGGGQSGDTLILDDQKSSSGHTYGVSASGVTRDGNSILAFSNFANLTLSASDQADTINITATASGVATTVNANGGLDTFGAIDQTTIAAAGLTVNSGGQGEALTLNGGSLGETIGVSATQVTRSSGGPITYAGLASLTVNGTDQADTINVTATASGASTTVNARGGNDTVTVGNSSHGLGNLAGPLTVDGGGQSGDTLILDDQKSSSGHTYGVIASGVTRDGSSILAFSNFANLTLSASDQADTINITATTSGVATTVNANGGLDTFGAIDQTKIAAAGLTVNGGGQGEALTLNGGSLGETIGVSATQVTRSSGGPITYAGLASLTVNGTAQADTITVTGTASGTATTVNAGGGLDTFAAIDQTTIAAAGLTIDGGGQGEALTLNGGSAGETIGVSATQVTRSDGGTVSYSGLASLTVNGTSQADTITVTATASGVVTGVNANGGNDTVTVGNTTTGLGDLAGLLTVDGDGQSNDTLILDDKKSPSAHTYGVSASGVTRDGISILTFSAFANLTLSASDQADTINVTSTASGVATTVKGNGGLDTFGAIDQTTIAAAGLTVDGGGQGEDLTINSTGGGPETIGVSGTQVTRSSGGPIALSGLGSLTVNGTDNATGDSFDVTPSASLPITIDGRNPTTAPGDTLNYSGTAGQINAVDANNGTITEAGMQPITYKSIETITGNSSLLLVLDAGAQANDGIPDSFLIRGNGGTFEAFVNGSLAFTSQTSYYHNLIVNGSGDNDFLTVDATNGNPIPKFGINFNPGGQTDASGDQLEVIGTTSATGGYLPGGTAGTGTVNVNTGAGDRPIIFNGLESATAHNLSDFTLTTPGSKDILTVDSPAAGQNRVQGTTDGVAITPLTFFDVTNFTVDTGANDGAQPDDSLTVGTAGLVASGLTNFTFTGGPGNDQLSLLGTNYATPGSATGLSFQGGAGSNTFGGGGDTNFTLQDSGVTSSAGGTVQFSQVQVANLTGGASNNTFDISGWTGTGSLTGAGGTADRVVDTAGSTFTLSDNRLTVVGRADMALSGIEIATLAGGSGKNSFDISGWTGTGSLTGSGDPASRVVATDDADFTLSNTQLTISGRANMTLSGIFVANLTGGASSNTFNIAGWTRTANIDGGTGGDTLNFNAGDLAVRTNPGRFTANGRRDVLFSNFEVLHLNNADAVDTFYGPDTADRGALAGLDAPHRFVQVLYLNALGRAGSMPELNIWVNVLNSPGGTTMGVAAGIEGSPEGRDHLVKTWYRTFLGRSAAGGEEQVWVNLLLQGIGEEQVLAAILASPEYYQHAQTLGTSGTADQQFVQSLYHLLLNRTGTDAEVGSWVSALPTLGRGGVAVGILMSSEFHKDLIEAYYNVLVHRPSETAGFNHWLNSGLDDYHLRLAFDSSAEFFSNG